VKKGLQFGYLHAAAIGHLALEADIAFIESQSSPKVVVWITTKEVANYQLLKLISRKLRVITNPMLRALILPLVKLTRGGRFDGNSKVNDRTTFVQDTSPVSFPLPVAHMEMLPQLLEEMNLDCTRKYICLVVRDELHSFKNVSQESAEITQYRNSSINDYEGAIKYLIDQGFNVVRMGRLAHKCRFTIDGFFDYANSDLKSDLNDLLLMANCEFVISTSSGIDELATLYRKPVYLVNYLPVGSFRVSQLRPLILPKGLRDRQKGNLLSLSQIVQMGLWEANATHTYESANIEIVNCEPRTITQFTIQVIAHFSSRFEDVEPFGSHLVSQFFCQTSKVPKELEHKVPKISDLWLNYPNDKL